MTGEITGSEIDRIVVREENSNKAKSLKASLTRMQEGGLTGSWEWVSVYAGKGGLFLWPLFGATNQLLAGLAFLVISFWLWRRGKPVWFVVLPTVFMLVMPAWAMFVQIPKWIDDEQFLLVFIAAAALILEAWMIVEACLAWPRAKGVLEEALPPLTAAATAAETRAASSGGPNC